MRRGRGLVVVGALALVFASVAAADWAGADPPKNTPLGNLPSSCATVPTGKRCIDAGVHYLDRARAAVGLPPYALPADFPSLSPARQMFILTNLDRIAYGLAPIPGLTAELSHDALVSGVWRADDPYPSNATRLNTWWPAWAGAFYNAPMAYEAFVWNDGPGSTNPRCTPSDHSRCWGHRHTVLWKYGTNAAMGAAAGRDSRHHRGYAMLLVGGSAGYAAQYTYTWRKAVADGAGTNTYDPGISPAKMCHVPIVIGLTLNEARRAIDRSHCSVGEVLSKYTDYVPGIVIEQHPAPGRTFAPGTRVRLILSLGPRG